MNEKELHKRLVTLTQQMERAMANIVQQQQFVAAREHAGDDSTLSRQLLNTYVEIYESYEIHRRWFMAQLTRQAGGAGLRAAR